MIYGERIRFRAPERADIPLFVRWLNDPEVIEGLLIALPLSHADEEGWFDGMLKRDQTEHPLTIEVRQGDLWITVGNCGFHNIDWRCRSCEVGIVIGEKAYWNLGYGTESMALVLKHGFQTLNMNRIALDVYEPNHRAIRAYEKAGFVLEGRKRQGMYKNGRFFDILQMSVLRKDWEAAHA